MREGTGITALVFRVLVFRVRRLSKGEPATLGSRGKCVEGSTRSKTCSWRDDLAWLLLRVIAELSPCTTTSLIAHVSGGDPPFGSAVPESHTRKLILDALLTLEILDFIRSDQKLVAITDKGRRCRGKLPVLAFRPHAPCFAYLRTLMPTLLVGYIPRLQRLFRNCFAVARLVPQRVLQTSVDRAPHFARRALGVPLQIWSRDVAPMIESRVTTLVVMGRPFARLCCMRVQARGIVLGNSLRQISALLWNWAKNSFLPQNLGLSGRGWPIIVGAALLLVNLSIAGAITFMSASSENARGTDKDWVFGWLDRSNSTVDAVAPVAPVTLIAKIEAIGTTARNSLAQEPAETVLSEPVEQQPADGAGAAPGATEQSPADPIVATIRLKLADPALGKGVPSGEIAALQAFYAARNGPPLWIAGMGFSARAQTVINEIQNADDWGLPSETFDLPPAGRLAATTEAQAADEIKLGLAILKYARFARGGRVVPMRISVLFDQKPDLRDPRLVLDEIGDSAAPDAYLRSLHPQQEQFERLRQALIKARADSEGEGRKPEQRRRRPAAGRQYGALALDASRARLLSTSGTTFRRSPPVSSRTASPSTWRRPSSGS